jgi:hypothetical protein
MSELPLGPGTKGFNPRGLDHNDTARRQAREKAIFGPGARVSPIPDSERERGDALQNYPWNCYVCGMKCDTYEAYRAHICGRVK